MEHNAENLRTIHIINEGVLVLLKKDDEKTESGIILPVEKEKVPTINGWVVKTGPGYHIGKFTESEDAWKKSNTKGDYIEMDIQEGDLATFIEKSSVKVKIKNVDYVMVKFHDILFIDRPE